jgi:hypothetical protein
MIPFYKHRYFILFLLPLQLLFQECQPQNQTKPIKVKFNLYYDGKIMPMGRNEMFIINEYTFEELYTHKTKTNVSRGKDGKLQEDDFVAYDSLINYVLTDINAKECLKFNLSTPPVLLQKIPINEKKNIGGFSFREEMYQQFEPQIKNFHFVKDSTIDKYNYAILEDTVAFQISNIFYRKARVFLNRNLKGLPVHLLSTGLDNLFNGIVTRIEFYDNHDQCVIMDWSISNPDAKEINFVEKYIRLCEEMKKSGR